MANNMTIDELAGMIKNEFDNVGGEFKKVNSRFDQVDGKLKELREDHETIELKMSNVAYRFEVDDLKNQLNLLKQRVESLEHK